MLFMKMPLLTTSRFSQPHSSLKEVPTFIELKSRSSVFEKGIGITSTMCSLTPSFTRVDSAFPFSIAYQPATPNLADVAMLYGFNVVKLNV